MQTYNQAAVREDRERRKLLGGKEMEKETKIGKATEKEEAKFSGQG